METTIQVEQATGLRIVIMGNLSERSRRGLGQSFNIRTLADVAIALDRANERSIEAAGGSGMGAGAFLEAVFDHEDPRDPDSTGETVVSIDDPVFTGYPIGSARELRAFVTAQRRNTCWNGQNHIQAPFYESEALLNRIRGR